MYSTVVLMLLEPLEAENRKWAGEVSSVLALVPFQVSLVVLATLFVPPEEDNKLSPNLLSNRISDGVSLEDSRLLSVVPTSDSAEWLNNNLMFKTFLPDKSPSRTFIASLSMDLADY